MANAANELAGGVVRGMTPADPSGIFGMLGKGMDGGQDAIMALLRQLGLLGGPSGPIQYPATGPLPQATGTFDPATGEQVIKQPSLKKSMVK